MSRGDDPSRPVEAAIAAEILALAQRRGPDRSFCPSEVARSLVADGGDWRSLMEAVRAAASRLRAKGRIEVTQRGSPVDPLSARGPIRFRLVRGPGQDG